MTRQDDLADAVGNCFSETAKLLLDQHKRAEELRNPAHISRALELVWSQRVRHYQMRAEAAEALLREWLVPTGWSQERIDEYVKSRLPE